MVSYFIGKTTLLNALSNRAPYGTITGEILFGNKPFQASDLMYVPQFDEIKPYCTVVEQIMLVGQMKCANIPDMKKRLMKLLQILGMFNIVYIPLIYCILYQFHHSAVLDSYIFLICRSVQQS